jgi:signal transduction histidine kinase
MLLELRPAALVKTPLHELLPQLTEATTSRSDLSFRLFIEQTPKLPQAVHTAFYRIAQEALNNTAKHAQAGLITLRLDVRRMPVGPAGEEAVEIALVVEDDGIGFAPDEEQVGKLGLGIMRERAADIGADLAIDSRIGQGTRLHLVWCGAAENGI